MIMMYRIQDSLSYPLIYGYLSFYISYVSRKILRHLIHQKDKVVNLSHLFLKHHQLQLVCLDLHRVLLEILRVHHILLNIFYQFFQDRKRNQVILTHLKPEHLQLNFHLHWTFSLKILMVIWCFQKQYIQKLLV